MPAWNDDSRRETPGAGAPARPRVLIVDSDAPLLGLAARLLEKEFTVAGLALGVAGSFALTRLLASLLFNVSATDVTAFVSAPLLLGAVALLACYIPARRATTVDPARVLKQD